jgi:hypothetical protein
VRGGALARRAAAAAVLGGAWGLFESQWVALDRVEVPVERLPRSLDGFSILHLSDFHLGTLSLNGRAVTNAVRVAERSEHDLVAVTGDLLSAPRGEPALLQAFGRLRARHGVYAVLGNHDVAVTRDPFSGARELDDLTAAGAVLLRDEAKELRIAGARVQVAGCEPRAFMERRARPWELADPAADLRILLCHFPDVVDRIPPGSFDLVLAGHLHGGQICLPYPGGKLRLSSLGPPYPEGVFRLDGTTLVVSRGIGTTFVPFRFCSRPQAAVLVLRAAR